MILTDDQRFDTLGATGHTPIKTPAIDRLARDGVLFENAFVITPVCAPSRATILTGRSTYAHRVTRNRQYLAGGVPTIATMLRHAGYETAFFGKYHLAADSGPEPGWSHWVGFLLHADGGRGLQYNNAQFTIDGRVQETKGYSTDVLAQFAADFIEADRRNPFFVVLSLKSPHGWFRPARRHKSLFDDVVIELPASYSDPLDALPAWLRGDSGERPIIHADILRTGFDSLAQRAADPVRELTRLYWRMIPSVDDAVASVVAALQRRGAMDKTVVIFAGDNGLLLGEHGIIGKGSAYDPSLRVPLIIHDPSRRTNAERRREQVLNLDLAPTILDYAGVAIPAVMSGRSMRALIDQPASKWRSDWLIVGHSVKHAASDQPQFLGVRSAEWKYVRYLFGGLDEQLFHLSADPDERHNLANDAAQAAVMERMRSRLGELMREAGMPAGWSQSY